MENDEKKCPYCAEVIKAEAIICKHCGRDVVSLGVDEKPRQSTSQQSSYLAIPRDKYSRNCPKCGYDFGQPVQRARPCPQCNAILIVRDGYVWEEGDFQEYKAEEVRRLEQEAKNSSIVDEHLAPTSSSSVSRNAMLGPKKKRGCLKIGLYVFLGMAVLGGIIDLFESPEKKAERKATQAREAAERELQAKQRSAERAKADEERRIQQEKDKIERAKGEEIRKAESEKVRIENEKKLQESRRKAVASTNAAIEAMIEKGYIAKIDDSTHTVWMPPASWFPNNRDVKELIMTNVGGYFMGKSGTDFPLGKIRSYSDDSLFAEIDGGGNVTVHK